MSSDKKLLSDFATVISGYAFKSEWFGTGNDKVIRIGDLQEGSIQTEAALTVDASQYKISDNFKIQNKDILMALSGATVGKIAVASDADVGSYINQRVAIIRAKDEITADYLKFFFSGEFLDDLLKNAGGAAQPNLSPKQLLLMEIPFPPLAEQRRIASILDQADELRQKRQLAIKKLDQLLQAEFISKFHQKNYPEFKVSNLLENDKSMRTGPFGSQLLHSEFVEEGIHVLGIDNAVQNSFNWAKPRFITEKKYKDLKRYTVKPKDVIITIMGTCGKCAVVPDDIPKAINTKHLCCITLDQNKCNPEFLHSYFLLHPTARNYLESRAKGAIMSGLNMGIIKELPVELPPIEMQNEFSKLKQKVILQKTLMIEELSKLNELFQSLQNQAFSGTL